MASISRHPNGQWRARYRAVPGGPQTAKHFRTKAEAQAWLDEKTAALVRGDYVTPRNSRMTVAQWCEAWLVGYGTRRPGTVRSARTHIAHITKAFGPLRLSQVRPSAVKAWTASMREAGYSDSFVHATYRRLSQIMGDAVHDGLLSRSPCSRRTSPGGGKQRPYVATTEQVWALYDAMPAHLRKAVLLGAFVGLRVGEVCGLRTADVDFLRCVVSPAVQYPAEPLKTEASEWPVPIPRELATLLARGLDGPYVVAQPSGAQMYPREVERALEAVRGKVPGLPTGFRFQDLRHFYASLLISQGLDVKTVQTRLRHASARTTLDTYAHMWPDRDESSRAAVAVALAR